MENENIVLIGPACTGKSTIAPLLARTLGRNLVSLDKIATQYYEDFGFTRREFQTVEREYGYLAAYDLWRPALVNAVERVMREHERSVIELGAGHSHFERGTLFDRVFAALDESVTILLLPTADLKESISILRTRNAMHRGKDWRYGSYDFIERWVLDESNWLLADLVVYAEGRAADKTTEKIVNELHAKNIRSNEQNTKQQDS